MSADEMTDVNQNSTKPKLSTSKEPPSKLHLNIFSTLSSLQLSNGLRHGDYIRYSQFCAKRLKKLRSQLNLKRKGKPSENFKSKILKPSKCNTTISLMYPLLQSERAFAYASACRQKLSQENVRPRFQLMRKMKRARQWSFDLLKICILRADAITCLQAQAYHLYMKGLCRFEKADHLRALEAYSDAKQIFEKLNQLKSSGETKVLYREKLESISDSLRMCEYMLQQSGIKAKISKLDVDENTQKLIEEAKKTPISKEEQEADDEVQFNGQSILVSNNKVRELRSKANTLKAQLCDSKLNDSNLKSTIRKKHRLHDLYVSALRLIEEDMTSAKSESQKQILQQLRQYFNAERLQVKLWLLERETEVLRLNVEKILGGNTHIEQSKNKRLAAENLVFLYERWMRALDHLDKFPISDLKAGIQENRCVIECFRVAALAMVYHQKKQFSEAYSLYQLAMKRLQQASRSTKLSISILSIWKAINGSIERLSALCHADGIVEQCRAESSLTSVVSQMSLNNSKNTILLPLLNRLQSTAVGSSAQQYKLVDFPPKLELISVKPILFDLAFNDFEMPRPELIGNGKLDQNSFRGHQIVEESNDQEMQAEETPQDESKPKQTGKSLFSRLWGR